MNEEITKDKLRNLGLNEETIEMIYSQNMNYESNKGGKNAYYISKPENKIYTGVDAARKIYFKEESSWHFLREKSNSPNPQILFPSNFPELFSEYYSKKLEIHLTKQKEYLSTIYNEDLEKGNFLESEISLVNKCIETIKDTSRVPEFWEYPLGRSIRDLEAYLNHLKKESTKKIATPNKNKNDTTYKWKVKPEEIETLFNRMKGKFIANDTTYEEFEAIFSGKPIKEITPIKWHKENASELLFFILTLSEPSTYDLGFNMKIEPKKHIYKTLVKCFVKSNKKPFEAKWKSLRTDIQVTLSQENQDAVKALYRDL
jgi:hypothetical protein